MGPQSISSIFFGKIPFFPACTRVYEVFWSVLIVFKICSGMDIKSSPPRSALKLVLKGTSFTWARMQHTSSVKHLSLLVCPSRDVIRWISGSSLMWRLHICRRLYWEIYLPIQSPSKKLFKAGSPLPPCVHGSGVSWEEWQGSSRVVLLQDIQEPLGHLQCSAGRSEDDGASGVKWVRFICYCLVLICYDPSFLTLDICGYLPLRKNQRNQLIHYLFYMDIVLGSALLQDQTFFDQDTSLDDWSQSGHLRVEKLFPLTDREWQFGVSRTLRTFPRSDTDHVQQSTKGS